MNDGMPTTDSHVIKSIAEWRNEQEMKAIAELPPERPAPAVAPR